MKKKPSPSAAPCPQAASRPALEHSYASSPAATPRAWRRRGLIQAGGMVAAASVWGLMARPTPARAADNKPLVQAPAQQAPQVPPAPLPAWYWPSEAHWQRLREQAPHSPAVQAVMRTQYQLVARHWQQAARPLSTLPPEPRWQGQPPASRRAADSLAEFEQMQALAFLYQLSGQAAYRERALELMRPWAHSLAPVAQPLALRWLEPGIWAYRLLRPGLVGHEEEDRRRLDRWWQAHAQAQQDARPLEPQDPDTTSRRHSHRLCSVGLIGLALGDPARVEWARRGLQQQLMDNLRPAGETLDYARSGELAEQVDDLRPLITLALALRETGTDLYHWNTPAGASMAHSVAWLLKRLQGGGGAAVAAASTRLLDPAQLQPLLALIEAWQPGVTGGVLWRGGAGVAASGWGAGVALRGVLSGG